MRECFLSLKGKKKKSPVRRQQKVQNWQDISQSISQSKSLVHYNPFIMVRVLVFQVCLCKPVNIICASMAAICLVSHTKYSLVVAPNVIKQNVTLP